MGSTNSRYLDNGGAPEASQLLHAVKKGEHLRALRLLSLMPESSREISQGAKASAVHLAVKRGYVNILQFLRDLPVESSNDRPIAAEEATIQTAYTTASLGSVGAGRSSGYVSSPRRASRLTRHQASNGRVVDQVGRQSGHERESWLNAVDRHGRTPLMTAVRYNRLDFVEGLVSLGADPWACDRTTRATALHLAAVKGLAPLVTALLRSTVTSSEHHVALYDAQDMYGFTPLHYAALAGHAEVARVLLDAGASYIASSQLLYYPTPVLRRLTSLTQIAGRSGLVLGLSFGGDRGRGEDRSAALAVPCAPRSNPLHLAALRGDAAVATLVLQRFLADTEGLSRQARERVTDPRTQLNKDGFLPYMLAGNAAHWHVAQLLIPHSRDDRHYLTRNRDRDLLILFPLPDPAAATSASGGGEGAGPPSLAELAARVWAAKLLADIKSADAAVRQIHQRHTPNYLAGSPVSFGGGVGVGSGSAAAALFRESVRNSGGSGMLGSLLRRSGRNTGISASGNGSGAIMASNNTSSRRGQTLAASSLTITAASATPAAAAVIAAASPVPAQEGYAPAAVAASASLAGASPGPSVSSSPRTSVSGGGWLGPAGFGGGDVGGGGRTASPPRRSLFLPTTLNRDSRRRTSLDLILRTSGPPSAITAIMVASPPSPPPQGATSSRPLVIPPAWPMPPLQQAVNAAASAAATEVPAVATVPGSPIVPPVTAAAPPPPLCDVCFEHFQELALKPCPHRLCVSCCRRVVEMHCSGVVPGVTAAGTRAASGRRVAAVPPRCPFCQATIRGFMPAPMALRQ
ncbi:hypothetical protein VaNZ11_006506 [Volvox africanus]|uniref:RING-type domain-containing protein n=1 Tax=Volvox africanus TaxID=51714 RepID=A0ABQ5S1J3_9CHLO|nr:hypothetical protein VaNZ11_006506 [Volvox africanus]